MLRRSLLSTAAFAVLLLPVTAPRAGDDAVRTAIAEGVGFPSGGDAGKARDQALDNALRKAVEQVAGTMIESQTATDNYEVLSDRIYSQSRGYVKSYKILSEKTDPENGALRVKVEAQVSEGQLNGDLAGLHLLQQRMKMPRVTVLISEHTWDHAWWWGREGISEPEALLIKLLKEKGFTVVDAKALKEGSKYLDALSGGNDTVLSGAAKSVGAEVLIYGQAELQDEGSIHNSTLRSYAGHITLRAVKADTGESLASSTGAAKTAEISGTGALSKIYKPMVSSAGNELISEIAEKWRGEVSGGRMVLLTVSGLTKAQADTLQGQLTKMVRGAQAVTLRGFAGGAASYDLNLRGDAEDLGHELAKVKVNGRALEITAQSQNTVTAILK